MNIKISAVIITFNEEKKIQNCLNSLLPVADEIIVIDSFSTDKTPEICQQQPKVRFFEHTFEGYAAQKNIGIQYAQNPFILSIDADECLSKTLINSILKVKQNCKNDFFSLHRRTNFAGKWIRFGDWQYDTKIRLWNSQKANWGGTVLHESLQMPPHTKPTMLKGYLLHYSFDNIQHYVNQMNKYTELGKNDLIQKKAPTPNLYHFFVKPLAKFCIAYFFRLGFLDGFYGFFIAKSTAYGAFLKYAKYYEYLKNKKTL